MKFLAPYDRDCRLLLVIAAVCFGALRSAMADEPAAKPDTIGKRLFDEQVRPLLAQKCLACHGEDGQVEGGLDLSSCAGLLRGGESKQPAITPGDPEKSRLLLAVTRRDPKLVMPPEEADRLTDAQITSLRDWIAAGAPWVDEPATSAAKRVAANVWEATGPEGVEIPTSGGQSDSWTHRKYQPADLWAYRPLRRQAIPHLGLDPADMANPIDAFIRSRLAEREIKPAAPADRATWLRRATFDLTGLPPTPQELDAFLADVSPEAAAKVLDRLLASPHYGEQMARLWLDVVRYSDTSGFSNDYERPHAWRYRDYVVRSFNQDKPYDRFITEQLAGDELDAANPEMLIAVGFLRMGPWEHTAMSVAVETRQQFLDDVTQSVGVTFLGQALCCCRCHDHKFDPLPTRDYYRLQAVFAPVQFQDRTVPFLPQEETSSLAAGRPRTERLLHEANNFLDGLKRKHDVAVDAWLVEHGHKSLDEVPGDQRPQRHLGLSKLEMSLEKVFQKRVDYYTLEMRRYEPQALCVYDGPLTTFNMLRGQPGLPGRGNGKAKKQADKQATPSPSTTQVVHILKGGAVDSPGEIVSPGVLSAAFGSSDRQQPTAWNTIPGGPNGRRLALAQWIAAANNPLTARVIVNRIWQQHFGRGLVATPNNFGKMGSRPTNPELLDFLSVWFVDHDWSIKKLHRLIMTSQTYRQSSEHADFSRLAEIDARNELLAYYPVRRLAAEEIRDSMLAISGELNACVGGPPVFPEINWEVALQPRHIMGSVAPAYQPSPRREDRHRRTLYAFHCRTLSDPLFEVLNKPGSEISCERRDETIVAPQSLALFNGATVHDRALALAKRLEERSADPRERVDTAFLWTYGRRPHDDERQKCLEHVVRMTEYHRTHSPQRVEPARSAAPGNDRRVDRRDIRLG